MEEILRRLSLNDSHFTHLDLSKVDVDDEQLQLIADQLRNNPFINRVSWKERSHYKIDLKQQIEDEIELKQEDHHFHPTDFAHGLLSYHVYTDSKEGDSPQLQGCAETWNEEFRNWKVIKVFIPDDISRYYSVAYLNEKRKQIVLAHRGFTLISFWDFIKPDSPLKNFFHSIYGGKIRSHQMHAFDATYEVIKYAEKKGCIVTFTGHSLGAWLAELSLYHAVYDLGYYKGKAVTFDGPGSARAMERLNSNVISHATKRDIENLQITTYLAAPNLLNVCNPRIGKIYRIYPKSTWAKLAYKIENGIEKIPILKHLKPSLMCLLSIHGHSIKSMVATFNPTTGKPVKWKKVLDWPCKVLYNSSLLDTSVFHFVPALLMTLWMLPQLIPILLIVWLCNLGGIERSLYKYYDMKCYVNRQYTMGQTNLSYSEKQLKNVHYRDAEVLNSSEDLYNKYSISDRFLHRLYYIGTDQIDEMGIATNLREALKNLKLKYKIITKKCKKYISASDIQIDNLRGEIMKLCEHPNVIHMLENKNANFSKNENEPVTIISNLPELPEYIVERPDVQKKITEVFNEYKVVVISAFTGFGKSTMAKIYGCNLQEKFSNQVVRFIDADSSNKINSEYRQIADDLKIRTTNETAKKVMQLVHSHIEKSKLSVLFIFDNVEKFEDVKIYLDEILNLKNCKVIITTRSHNLSKDVTSIELNPFTKEEATPYVKKSLGGRWSAENIINLIDKLSEDNIVRPYRLSHAVTYLNQHPNCSAEEYMERLKKSNDETGTYLLFDALEKSKLSWRVLQYSAYLDPDFISTDIFKEICKDYKVDLQVVIDELEGLSLISSRPSRSGHCGFQVHRMIQELVKKYACANKIVENKIDEQSIFDGLIQVINTLFPNVMNELKENVQMSRILYPHAANIFQRKIHCNKQAEMSELYDKLGDYTRLICEFAQALNYHETALEMKKQALHCEQSALNFLTPEFPELPIHSDIANSLDSMGFDYYGMDENCENFEYFAAAYKMRRALHPGKHHPDIPRYLHSYILARLLEMKVSFGEEVIKKGLKYNEE